MMKLPKPHQVEAINSTVDYFKERDNGKLIMPCGSGKTMASIWIAQRMRLENVVVVLPNLTLESQTLKEWVNEMTVFDIRHDYLCVCSDETVADGIRRNLDITVTTDVKETQAVLKRCKNLIVLVTYQSGHILAKASKGLKEYDIIIFDEAHHTAGLEGKPFSYLIYDKNIKSKKRLFMTATSRFYGGKIDDVISMDDDKLYGDYTYKLLIRDAINRGILCDYNIYTTGCSDAEVREIINKNPDIIDKNHDINEEMLIISMAVASIKAYKSFDIKRSVSYHTTIARAKKFAKVVKKISDITTFHINGTQSVDERKQIISDFESCNKAILTNSRALTEGIDIPELDGIIYADAKTSTESIVQSTGRALRNPIGIKDKIAKVIIPISTDKRNNELSIEKMKVILYSLSVNDNEIMSEFAKANGRTRGDYNGKRIKTIETENRDINDIIDSIYVSIYPKNLPFSDEEIINIAKKYKTRADWGRGDRPSYFLSMSRGKEFHAKATAHMIRLVTKLTDDEIISDAKKYKTLKDWRSLSVNMYSVALKRGKEFYTEATAHMTRLYHRDYTKKELADIAGKYTSVKDFKLNDNAAYIAIRKNKKFFHKVTLNMTRQHRGRFTDNKLIAIANKYEYLLDLRTKDGSAYSAMSRRGREFYAKATAHLIRKFKSYTDDELIAIANKYEYLLDLRTKDGSAYSAMFNRGREFYEKVTAHLVKKIYWTESRLMIEAKKYKTRGEWANATGGSYDAALKLRREFYAKATAHMVDGKVGRPHYIKWTDEKLLAESKNYKTKVEWSNASYGSYTASLKRGKEFHAKATAHMIAKRRAYIKL